MTETKKIATRESYGNALAELGAQFPALVVLDTEGIYQQVKAFVKG